MILKKYFKDSLLFNSKNYLYLNISYFFQTLMGLICVLQIIYLKDFNFLGIFSQFYTCFVILGHLFAFGIGDSILRNIPISKNNNQSNDKLLSAIVLTILIGFILFFFFLLIFTIFKNYLEKFYYIFNIFFLISVFIFSINKIFFSYYNATGKIKYFSFLNSIRPFLIAILLFRQIKNEEEQNVALIFLITELIIFILCLIKSSHTLKKSLVKFSFFQLHFNFGKKILFNNILSESLIKVDIICLSLLLSTYHVGLYSFASFFFEGFYQFLISIKNNINPMLSKLYFVKNIKNLFNLIRISSLISLILAFIYFVIVLSVYLFIKYFRLPFEESALILLILVIGLLFYSFIIPMENIFSQTNRPALQSYFMFILFFVNLILNVIFIKLYDVYGAAIATTLSYVMMIPIFLFFFKKIFKNKLYFLS